jgi:NAD(P)-dependent dehydrogenase (short-subunit alcohol dehydrogenase family)
VRRTCARSSPRPATERAATDSGGEAHLYGKTTLEAAMSIRRALVIGAGSGVGRATAETLSAQGVHVLASGSERDARNPGEVAALISEADPDLVVVAAGARPTMAAIEEQTWESFSVPWEVDVRIAFEVGRAALSRPLHPGSTVVIVSSGAGANPGGSPLSGGYAGAKRMQMLLASYLQRASDARELGIRFVALAPMQFLEGTRIGIAAADAYGAAAGQPGERYIKRWPEPLDAAKVAEAIVLLVSASEYRDATVVGVGGSGLEPI